LAAPRPFSKASASAKVEPVVRTSSTSRTARPATHAAPPRRAVIRPRACNLA
jgi:hypothetical protein